MRCGRSIWSRHSILISNGHGRLGTKAKPLSQKQLANLLKPFRIISTTVHIEGLADAKGYYRSSFAEAWASYLPGQNGLASPSSTSETSNRPNADGTGTSDIFPSVQEPLPDGSKNTNLSYSHAGLDAWTDRNTQPGVEESFDQDSTPVCEHCGNPATPSSPVQLCAVEGQTFLLHRACWAEWMEKDDLGIPDFLRREP